MINWLKDKEKVASIILPIVGLAILALIAKGLGPSTINHYFGLIDAKAEAFLFFKLGDIPLLGLLLGSLESIPYAGVPFKILMRLPLVVAVLVGGAIYFTFRFNFINFRGFKHGVDLVLGRYDDPNDPGEISHLQALSSALSATVGLGNIAGVAIAVNMGGPGAVFWMMFTALFGMASKFAECSLGQVYRKVDENGNVIGGPMIYLRDGLAETNLAGFNLKSLGTVLSVFFAILTVLGSFAGGNMFQANQSFGAVQQRVPYLAGEHATGKVQITAESPKDLEYPKHRVQLTVPSQQEYGNPLIYRPPQNLDISKDDWTQQNGKYVYNMTVEASKNGRGYNIKPNQIETFKVGEVAGGVIEEWNDVPGITSVTNPDKISGGKPDKGLIYGFILATLVGIVIIGGIESIGKVTEKIVPFMCGIYILAGIWIMLINYHKVPDAVGTILHEAFTLEAGWGVFIGVIIQGVRRAAFSSEAGIGSASIAHSAAKTNEPIREGMVALLEPFIDTIVVCFITGFVIVVSGVYNDPSAAGLEGIQLTAAAFGSQIAIFPWILSIAVALFAYSTMLSWSYYGERCWNFLLGPGNSLSYQVLFLIFIIIGSVSSLGNVLSVSDVILLTMAFPNIIGLVLLSDKISDHLDDYWKRYKSGEFTMKN